MNRIRLSSCLLACLVISGCARREDDGTADVDALPAPATQADQQNTAATNEPDAVQPPLEKVVAGVQVRVSLSPAAQAEMSRRGETIVVEATYAGDPTAESSSQTNEFGLVELGQDTRELDAAGTISFDESLIDRSRLPLISGHPQIMLNVRSGRKAGAGNLLACDLYWDSVAAASAAPVEIPCRLLSEQ